MELKDDQSSNIIKVPLRRYSYQEATMAMVHLRLLHVGRLPVEGYDLVIIPPQPDFEYKMSIYDWLIECKNGTALSLYESFILQRMENPETPIEMIGVNPDMNRFVFPLKLVVDENLPVGKILEIQQECISVINLILFDIVRFSDEGHHILYQMYSLSRFLSRLKIQNQKGVSKEVYEQSLKERLAIIWEILRSDGVMEYLSTDEISLLTFLQYLDRKYKGRNRRRRNSEAYEAVLKFVVMLSLMQRDLLTSIVPNLGDLFDPEHAPSRDDNEQVDTKNSFQELS